ncbi:MAG: GNAT family N-acetyltransferase [Candidatus Bipolaricaulota bacterium]|nr:GNAT family N-acetyltransferase [Candidatus Bipolaricaulota bacterium]
MERSEKREGPVRLRSDLKPGDIGTIVHLHGVVYAQEHGWDYTFEGYVAEGLARFALSHNPRNDRLWIAEANEGIVGSVGVVGQSATEAQLRWFLVHPAWRGRGLGRRLLNEALQFCRERRFGSVFLWTTSDLEAAAHLYQQAGFRKTDEKKHRAWGQTVTEERYDMSL